MIFSHFYGMKRILSLPLLAFILLYSCKTSEFSNGTFTKRKYRKG
jgi:major membrane immunogen (membrane-anchored lipoprotein)